MRPLSQRSSWLSLAPMIVLAVVAAGCASQAPPETMPVADDTGARDAGRMQAGSRDRSSEEPLDAGAWGESRSGEDTLGLARSADDYVLQTVYFDYDQSEIRADQRATLQANAQFLRENGRLRILIGGHADERGTREYNHALGERRASSTMQYLVALGVPRDRIEIISYGEEQPVMVGESESSYAQNRRAEFRLIEGR